MPNQKTFLLWKVARIWGKTQISCKFFDTFNSL